MNTELELLKKIKQLYCIAEQALDLVDEYAGGESETADELRDALNDFTTNMEAFVFLNSLS
jgi:hypothetical protein